MNLTRIKIGSKDLPIRIDYNVLEEIEEIYGTTDRWQQELLGFRWKMEEDGSYCLDEEGKPIPVIAAPSLKALKTCLTLMVNEGLKAEAYEQNTEYIPMDPDVIVMECEIDRNYLAEIINQEMTRCQRVKKTIPGEAGKNRKRSTLPGSK